MSIVQRNWAGNHRYAAERIATPSSVAELIDLVRRSPAIHPLGTRHSFNDVADSTGVLVSTAGLMTGPEAGFVLDPTGESVWAPSAARYGDLARWLQAHGLALHNLASLPHISIAGSVATGTHGSGSRNRGLASAVTALELVDGRGEVRTLARDDPAFPGAVVGLGLLGVVTRVALEVRPTFQVRQDVVLDLSTDAVLDDLGGILGTGYSTSIFTRWQPGVVDQVWVKSLTGPGGGKPPSGVPATTEMHPIRGVDPENCTPQLGVPGPWHERLPHFRLDVVPSAGEEIQSELFVAAADGPDAFRAIAELGPRFTGLLLVSEIRAVAADELWLSPSTGRDSVAFHFTWRRDPGAVREAVGAIEEALRPFAARPHWGKVSTIGATELAALYPRWDDFLALRAMWDPDRRFIGPHARRSIMRGWAAA